MKNTYTATLDNLETVLGNDGLSFERFDGQIVLNIPYKWSKFCLIFSLCEDLNVLHVSCSSDLTLSDEKEVEIFKLLALANDKLLIGHFAYDFDFKTAVYRYSIPLGEQAVSQDILASVKDYALAEFHRFYLSFFYVVYGNKSASNSLVSAMVDCAGIA
jgi:hypothetical protein